MFSLKSPSQHSLLYYWPESCHVARASANQQAGSSSCPKAAESNIEKGSFPDDWKVGIPTQELMMSTLPFPPDAVAQNRNTM